MSYLNGDYVEPIGSSRSAGSDAAHQFQANEDSTATSAPSEWWQQVHIQCKEQLEKTELTIRKLRAIYASESTRDQQARRTIAAMLAKLSSIQDYLVQLQSGEERSSEQTPLNSHSTDPKMMSGGNDSGSSGQASAASKPGAPYKSLKRLRIDEAENADSEANIAAGEGNAQPMKRARLGERQFGDDATESFSEEPTVETEDISEEVERRLREKRERREKRWAGREMKRKRGDDDDDQIEMASQREQLLKRLRTDRAAAQESAYAAIKRKAPINGGHHQGKKRFI